MFDFWPVYSGERFRASGPSCYLCIPRGGHLNEVFLCFLAHQPCRSRLSQLRKETDLTLTFLLVNVSLGSAEKLKTSVDYARSLTCQSRFHVAVSFYFVTLWGLKLMKL